MAEGQYRIVKVELPLLGGIAGHNFLVLIDPNGNVISEFHGLATDAEGRAKPIGNLPSDRLKGHHDKRWYQPDFAQAEVASGDQAKIMSLWNAAAAARTKMDARDIHYPWFGLGQNSNSYLSTLIASMGLTEPRLHGGAPVKPGAGSMLLDPEDIHDIQRQFNIGAARAGDAPNSGSQPGGDQLNPLDSARRPFSSVGAPDDRTIAPRVRSPRSLVMPPRDLPSTAVSGAKGPTSLGGPNGPAPLTPPLRLRSQAPSIPAPAGNPTPPPLYFAPNQLSSPAFPSARFPLEALLAPDRDRALDQWASPSPRRDVSPPTQRAYASPPGEVSSIARDVPSSLDRPPPAGLLGMIQEYMRNNGY
ncbi:hypothetical protein JQ544_25480 [Bradyrhizobium diazoefficiens]|nr:hypothetical protein [Bradyrhizobium diazoefficiens]MBR0814906.1 hypothetical protein [Bradyrhizobium diazoefficiens]